MRSVTMVLKVLMAVTTAAVLIALSGGTSALAAATPFEELSPDQRQAAIALLNDAMVQTKRDPISLIKMGIDRVKESGEEPSERVKKDQLPTGPKPESPDNPSAEFDLEHKLPEAQLAFNHDEEPDMSSPEVPQAEVLEPKKMGEKMMENLGNQLGSNNDKLEPAHDGHHEHHEPNEHHEVESPNQHHVEAHGEQHEEAKKPEGHHEEHPQEEFDDFSPAPTGEHEHHEEPQKSHHDEHGESAHHAPEAAPEQLEPQIGDFLEESAESKLDSLPSVTDELPPEPFLEPEVTDPIHEIPATNEHEQAHAEQINPPKESSVIKESHHSDEDGVVEHHENVHVEDENGSFSSASSSVLPSPHPSIPQPEYTPATPLPEALHSPLTLPVVPPSPVHSQDLPHVPHGEKPVSPNSESFEETYVDNSDPEHPKQVHIKNKSKSEFGPNGFSHEEHATQTETDLKNPYNHRKKSSSYASYSSSSHPNRGRNHPKNRKKYNKNYHGNSYRRPYHMQMPPMPSMPPMPAMPAMPSMAPMTLMPYGLSMTSPWPTYYPDSYAGSMAMAHGGAFASAYGSPTPSYYASYLPNGYGNNQGGKRRNRRRKNRRANKNQHQKQQQQHQIQTHQ